MNVSNEIVKEQTKSKVKNFFESISQNFKSFEQPMEDEKNFVEGQKLSVNTATSVLNVTENISETLAKTVKIGSSLDIKLPDIKMSVMKKEAGLSDSSIWEADNIKVLAFRVF